MALTHRANEYYPMRGFGRGRPFFGGYPTYVGQNYNVKKAYNDDTEINAKVSIENCEKTTDCSLTPCRPPTSDSAISEQGPSQGRCRKDENLKEAAENTNEVGELKLIGRN